MPPKRGPAKSDREKAGLRGIVTKFIYNNQGDKIEERTTTSSNPLDAANASAAGHAMGTLESKSLPDGALQNAGICRRTITYY